MRTGLPVVSSIGSPLHLSLPSCLSVQRQCVTANCLERPRIAGDPDWRPGLPSGSGVCSTLGPGVLDDWVKRFSVSAMHPDLLAVSAPTSVSASGCALLADLLSHQRSRSREGTVSSEARADGDLAAARDTSGGRSAHRSISQRVWVVWDQGRPRERVGSCETPPWWPAVSSSRHVELRVPDGGDATRTRGHKATSKPRRTGAPAPRWPMRSAWRRGGSSGPARQPPVAAWGGASTRLNRDKLEREQRPRW